MRRLQSGKIHEDDAIASIMNGCIRQARKDEMETSIDGRKYAIEGTDRAGLPFETIGKIIDGEEGREYFLITAYARI